MDLVELFRQKEIYIRPENAVKAEYIALQCARDLYSLAKGDLLLVKPQLTLQDAQELLSFKGAMDIFTMQPESLDAFDAQNILEKVASIRIIDGIGLSYLHSGDALYIFNDFLEEKLLSTTPNVVRLSPVWRKDIDTCLSIDSGVLASLECASSAKSVSEKEGPKQREEDIFSSRQNHEQDEIMLLRRKLCELFSSQYTEVRVMFSGTAPENRTISLSSFYEKHGIERGRLKGSWNLFEKNNRKDILDTGIVNRAKEAELNSISVSIPTYGRIIRSCELEELWKKMDAIAKDYRSYLDGDRNCKKVGSISVQKSFSPADIIEESLSGLKDYLHRIGEQMNAGIRYHDAVDVFVRNEWRKQKPFSELVSLQITSSTYTESQWTNKNFVDRFWNAVCDHNDFFDEEFLGLLDRYTRLLDKEQN